MSVVYGKPFRKLKYVKLGPFPSRGAIVGKVFGFRGRRMGQIKFECSSHLQIHTKNWTIPYTFHTSDRRPILSFSTHYIPITPPPYPEKATLPLDAKIRFFPGKCTINVRNVQDIRPMHN